MFTLWIKPIPLYICRPYGPASLVIRLCARNGPDIAWKYDENFTGIKDMPDYYFKPPRRTGYEFNKYHMQRHD